MHMFNGQVGLGCMGLVSHEATQQDWGRPYWIRLHPIYTWFPNLEERWCWRWRWSLIMYKLWENPVTSKFVTLETSSISWDAWINILAYEVMRRMLTFSEFLDLEYRNQGSEEFLEKITRPGYILKQYHAILESGLKEYKEKLGILFKFLKCLSVCLFVMFLLPW